MINTNLVSALAETSPIDATQLKTTGAAKDFEALLVGQMLRSVREEGSGWLGTGEDQSADAAFGLGEEQLARALSSNGGFGLSRLIETGLRKAASKSTSSPDQADTATRQAPSTAPPPGPAGEVP